MNDEICPEAIEAADEIDDAIEKARISGNWDGVYGLNMATIDNAIHKAINKLQCINCTEHNTGDCDESMGQCGDFVLRTDLRDKLVLRAALDFIQSEADRAKTFATTTADGTYVAGLRFALYHFRAALAQTERKEYAK